MLRKPLKKVDGARLQVDNGLTVSRRSISADCQFFSGLGVSNLLATTTDSTFHDQPMPNVPSSLDGFCRFLRKMWVEHYRPNRAPSTTKPASKSPDATTSIEAAKQPPEEDPQIVIVKHVAKTAPPPPPVDKSTEDIPPAIRESNGLTEVTDMPPPGDRPSNPKGDGPDRIGELHLGVKLSKSCDHRYPA